MGVALEKSNVVAQSVPSPGHCDNLQHHATQLLRVTTHLGPLERRLVAAERRAARHEVALLHHEDRGPR